eukprot:CAMPEP_0205907404 /NCGR_PEP_ID=MMETSP1325-20131115/2529_1 /ASSEMBLY_ACC=CAM_ASM_000708 /TAXON_ID=236786 /ORGANISM="Florenciella sp., Strain RCC1007" /LENGTH=87 /DNA_ID=CAMNT_0053273495 /DNA_START=17 /DNA_END=280 /DNA_ORIENTATION=+
MELPTGLPDDLARRRWEGCLAHLPYLLVHPARAIANSHSELRNVLAVAVFVVEEDHPIEADASIVRNLHEMLHFVLFGYMDRVKRLP